MPELEEFLNSPEMQKHIRYIRWLKRRCAWTIRLASYIRPHYCDACLQVDYCRRLQANERIMMDILTGKGCPDYASFWEVL